MRKSKPVVLFKLRKKVRFVNTTEYRELGRDDIEEETLWLERFVELPGADGYFPSFIKFEGEIFSGPIEDSVANKKREQGTKYYLCEDSRFRIKQEKGEEGGEFFDYGSVIDLHGWEEVAWKRERKGGLLKSEWEPPF